MVQLARAAPSSLYKLLEQNFAISPVQYPLRKSAYVECIRGLRLLPARR
jgi:hypothetical protein